MQQNNARQPHQHFVVICGLLVLAFMLVACGDSGSTPSAQQLIKDAQAAIGKVTAYHFNLATDNPGTGGSTINIKSADGDILVPDRLKANANALVGAFTVPVQVIAIADKQYYTDPVTGKWTQSSGLLDPRTLSAPQTGVSAILGEVQNPSAPSDSNVDGTACWSIDGKLDTRNLAGITGGGTPAGSTVATTICIGKADKLPYLIRIKGVAAQGDTSSTVRTFKLSKFNETLKIVAPS